MTEARSSPFPAGTQYHCTNGMQEAQDDSNQVYLYALFDLLGANCMRINTGCIRRC